MTTQAPAIITRPFHSDRRPADQVVSRYEHFYDVPAAPNRDDSACAAVRNSQRIKDRPVSELAPRERTRQSGLEGDLAMISISRSVVLVAGLLAFPFASTAARADGAAKPTSPGSTSTGDHTVRSGEAAMKSTAPGYMSTGKIHGVTGRSSENAATAQSGKKPAQ
jgi:hypothetical protein